MGIGPPPEFCVAVVLLALYFWLKPQGIAFTYAWWLLIALSWISGDLDCKCLTTALGTGLVGSWYVSQVVYPEVWPRLMPYWNEKCGERLSPNTIWAGIRIGDMFLHLVPAALLVQSYASHCGIRHSVYAWLYERLWWVLLEASLFGSGVAANSLYDFRPRVSSDLFKTAQGVATLLYFLPVILGLQGQMRLVCSALFGSALLNVCWDTPLVGSLRQRVVIPSTPMTGLLYSTLWLACMESIQQAVHSLPTHLDRLPTFTEVSLERLRSSFDDVWHNDLRVPSLQYDLILPTLPNIGGAFSLEPLFRLPDAFFKRSDEDLSAALARDTPSDVY